MTGYLYDAEGNRIAKGKITTMSCDPTANGFTFQEDYVLGLGGEQLSMLDGSGNWQRTNVYVAGKLLATYDTKGLHFHLTDPLGTRRMQLAGNLIDSSGDSILGRPEEHCQSLPYGDQLNCFPDADPPDTADDATPLHFTGKERDSESGNDYFGARYYASSMGRWLSPDWSAKYEPVPYAKLDNPQTLNLYAYVLNNPLTHFDPDGHACDSLWHCAQGFLNAIEVKVTAGIQTGISGQWGVAKAKAQATLIGAEAKSGLGGGNAQAKVQTKASASASIGRASASASVGGQVSTAGGASASASVKASVGPAEASATASTAVDQNGNHVTTSMSADPSKSVDTDSKLGFGLNALVGGEINLNFSQLGRAFGDAGDSLNALGSYLMDKYMPSGAPSSSGGAPGIPDPQHPF